MRTLFVLSGPAFFRFVDGTVRELAAAGHEVIVLTPQSPSLAMERCSEECGARMSTYSQTPFWPMSAISALRHLRSYRHWLAPERKWSDFLRRRWATTEFGFPKALRLGPKLLGLRLFDFLLSRVPQAPLRWLESASPVHPGVRRRLLELQPDLVVATPMIYPSPRRHVTEVEFLKAAKRLQVPSAGLVASWDNLTMKGAFHVVPDLVLVWNQEQIREAERLHGIRPERVAATGAPLFDPWLAGEYRRPRSELLQNAGLDAADRYLLYVESSAASGDEWELVHELAAAIDDSSVARPELAELRIVVRRHPGRRDLWRPLEHPRLLLYPPKSVLPDTREARTAFFNSIAHAEAVVGVNTTVFLEAAVADRPCVALMPRGLEHFQEGLAHFHYLLASDLLEIAGTCDEAASAIAGIVGGEDRRRQQRGRFVDSFLRSPDGSKAADFAAQTLARFALEATGAGHLANRASEPSATGSLPSVERR